MNLRKTATVVAMMGTLSGASIFVANSAFASGCFTSVSGTYGTGYCTGTTITRYYAQVQCYDPIRDSYSYAYGPTVSQPNQSGAFCAASHGNAVGVSIIRA